MGDMNRVDMDMVDMDMVEMDMDIVDVDMVDVDMVNRKFLVNFIYLGSLPRIISRTCLDSLAFNFSHCICPIKILKYSGQRPKIINFTR